MSGEGGLWWGRIRNISGAFDGRFEMHDTERGAGDYIRSDSTASETTSSFNFLSTFTSTGYTGWDGVSGYDVVSWCFRRAQGFFDVVTWTGDGTSGRQIAHNLGTTVGAIFVKQIDNSNRKWSVFHRKLDDTNPSHYKLHLDQTDARADELNIWNDTEPTSTHFTVGSDGEVNGNGGSYVAYLFAHNDSDGGFGIDADQDIIKCGSYNGNNGQSHHVELGFEPQWLLVKNADLGTSGAWWSIVDVNRGMGDNAIDILKANVTDAEIAENGFTPTPTGFTVENNNDFQNNLTNRYIYIAIRRGPMAVPEDANDVFAVSDAGRNVSFSTNFVVDMWLGANKDSTTPNNLCSRLTDRRYMNTAATSAEELSNGVASAFSYRLGTTQDNFIQNTFGSTNRVDWVWGRAPNFCDVVTYSGNGNSPQTHSHNLGVAPEMMWVKNRGLDNDWAVYHKDIPVTNMLYLNADLGLQTGKWASTAPTSTAFTTSGDARVGASGSNYVAYLFATLDGVSKVGSYTGTGATLNIDCGFSSGARFVLIKKTNGTGPWAVFDTERGIAVGNDPYLELDQTTSENSTNDRINPYSSGFSLSSNGLLNGLNDTFIFYAIA